MLAALATGCDDVYAVLRATPAVTHANVMLLPDSANSHGQTAQLGVSKRFFSHIAATGKIYVEDAVPDILLYSSSYPPNQ